MTTDYFQTNGDSGYCRLCANLTPEIDLTDIKNSLKCKILQCLQLQIDEHDCLPKQACTTCKSKVCSFHEFYDQVVKAQQILSELQFKIRDESPIPDPISESNTSDISPNSCEFTLNAQDEDDVNFNTENFDLDEKFNDISEEQTETETKIRRSPRKKNWTNKKELSDTLNTKDKDDNDNDNVENYDLDEKFKEGSREQTKTKTKIRKNRRKKDQTEEKRLSDTLNTKDEDDNDDVENYDLDEKFKEGSKEQAKTKTKMRKNCWKIDQTEEKNVSVTNYVWKCNECKEVLASVNDLRDHFDSIHQKPVEYVCTECSKVYGNYHTFRNHVLLHSHKFRFRCDVCDKFCSSATILRIHKERHNKNRQKYFCATCGKGFLSKNYLSAHVQRKHASTPEMSKESKKTHECDVCHNMFSSVITLKIHKKLHTAVPEHTCEHCGKTFINKYKMRDHLITHSDERPFKCELCPKRFKAKSYLESHQFLHTGLKPHQCDKCDKKFSRKSALVEHSYTHTDLYPFKCETCDKGFRSKKIAKWHQRFHAGEKVYSCSKCHRHFSCSSSYDEHMKQRHGVTKKKSESIEIENVLIQRQNLFEQF